MNVKSEFTCCVASVVRTAKHPDADKLDIVDLHLGFGDQYVSVINSRGDVVTGEHVAYIGPDSIVPISGPFEFLSSRLDAKGKTHYRIRSARIRGIYSPGLLVKLPSNYAGSFSVGTDLSHELGVTSYDTDSHLTGTANKAGSVPKVSSKNIFPVYSVYSLKKVPDLFEPDEEVYVTEKIHGTNFRFGYGGGRRFYFGTHRTNLSDTRGLWARFISLFSRKSWTNRNPGFGDPWHEAVEKFDLKKVCKRAKGYIFYGELYGTTRNGSPVQKGFTYGFEDLRLSIFDIYDVKNKKWLNESERFTAVNGLYWHELPFVPCVWTGKWKDLPTDLVEQDSVVSRGGSQAMHIREGIVIESTTDATKKAKLVSQRYHLSKHD